MADLAIPDLCLVLLVGASSSGKSTFAAKHFLDTEVISSDRARAMISDDEDNQDISAEAFELVRYWAGKRLAHGKLTVIDATNLQPHARRPLLQLARDHDVLPVAIVIDMPVEICQQRNQERLNRQYKPHVIKKHSAQLKRSVGKLRKEGFRYVHHLKGEAEIAEANIVRQKRWTDRRDERGPFDIIGDVHGCHEELVELLGRLGYVSDGSVTDGSSFAHPEGRTAVFVGDLVDRGPGVPETLELVMSMVRAGQALCVAGNHEAKLLRAMQGRDVKRTHGLAESLEQLDARSDRFRAEVVEFLDGLISHYLLDDGRLVVSHAGLPEQFHNRSSGRVRSFCLYGETTGETDEFGLPVRYQWADDYRGDAAVVYGHTPVPSAGWINNTICLDTGCVFGGSLTALRWPERELVSVDAAAEHYEPIKPLRSERRSPSALELTDVLGRRSVETTNMGRLTIDEEQNAAALELASRFTVDPRWLAYLPPTMAPVATAKDGPWLERPAEAFDYYASAGLDTVVCQEKHMGSRAIAIIGRTPEALANRFGFSETGSSSAAPLPAGMILTRTGRQFFDDPAVAEAAAVRLRDALDKADAWDRYSSDWLIIDGELLPWSAKAEPLIRHTYAGVGAAGELWAPAATELLRAAVERGQAGEIAEADVLSELLSSVEESGAAITAFRQAYRPYVTPTDGLVGISFAPFTIVAAEGSVTALNDNPWHIAECDRLVEADPAFVTSTQRREVDLREPNSRAEATEWWTELTASGGEGMVVKPLTPVSRGPKGLIQPGIKCRGPEYLRIVYGPEYTVEQNLTRLRSRSLNRKRSLALREFSLGVEALTRFVAAEPLWRVHECVFSVLALESDPVDPRL